jgi:D-3-phosphoglycerate dehydrogenase / 2-oxoglutarate reductase
LAELITDFDVIIAGTEPITKTVMDGARNLKMISRVGIGLDNIDLLEAEKKGIIVSYTPDAPAPAVAELTVGMMLTLLRSVHVSNLEMHKGKWHRFLGKRLSEITIGILGAGRIGSKVIQHLQGFGEPRILLNDILPREKLDYQKNIVRTDKKSIYQEADVISLHLPLTNLTKNMIKKEQLLSMKRDAILINTARGGIINENDLYDVMQIGHLGGAAIDVFNQEPYYGKLNEISRCLLTAHMGSMSVDCRTRMEVEATEEVVRFLSKQKLTSVVPHEEYNVQRQGLQ